VSQLRRPKYKINLVFFYYGNTAVIQGLNHHMQHLRMT